MVCDIYLIQQSDGTWAAEHWHGKHLIAYVVARTQGWALELLRYLVEHRN